MLRHAQEDQLGFEEVGDDVVIYGRKRHLVHRRRISQPRVLAVGLAWAASLLLASCESTTAPTPRGAADASLAEQLAATRATTHIVVVTGTGDPAIDVPAVQAAVDQGGTVILKGHFSFGTAPTRPVAPLLASSSGGYPPAAEVLVSKGVVLSGRRDADGEMTTIEEGTIPFYVDAPGERVTIRGLRFVRPIADAILVYAVRGVEIVSSRIEGVVPFAGAGEGIGINTSGGPPNPTSPGHPENVSGALLILHNDIDATGGTAHDNTLGITIFSVGIAGAEVEAHVSGNTIRNTTEPAINIRRVGGRAHIERNVITTGSVAGRAARDQAIRVANTGSYLIAHNSIECGWASADAEGIGVFSQIAAWPIEGAIVVDNEVTLSAPLGTVFSDFSAGIGVYGFAQHNVVRHNRIRGRARAGLSIPAFPLPPQAPAVPQDNAFIRNGFVDFVPSLADIFVGEHALRTRIVGPGTVVDRGDQTITGRWAPRSGGRWSPTLLGLGEQDLRNGEGPEEDSQQKP
jgi:hypothetical protein